MVNKNNNHDAGCAVRDAGCEGEESSMIADGLARRAQDLGWVQSLKFEVQSREVEIAGGAEFEDLRLKTAFRVEEHAKAWTPYGGCAPPRPPSLALARQASVDMVCRFMALEWPCVQGNGPGSPGKSAVAADLASAVHDDFGWDWSAGADVPWVAGRCSLIPTVSHLFPHFSHKKYFGERLPERSSGREDLESA
jgi:hypothetical protein